MSEIAFVGHRTMSLLPPGEGVYHLPARHHYGTKTRCGIVIWDRDQREPIVWPIRRDTAELIARLCGKCDR